VSVVAPVAHCHHIVRPTADFHFPDCRFGHRLEILRHFHIRPAAGFARHHCSEIGKVF
jgi:hypothetical protein